MNVFTLRQNYLEFKILVIYPRLCKYNLYFALKDLKSDRLYCFKEAFKVPHFTMSRDYILNQCDLIH